mgnify:CR=1 FL=1
MSQGCTKFWAMPAKTTHCDAGMLNTSNLFYQILHMQALATLKSATALPIVPVSALHAAGLHRLAHALQVAVATARARANA